VCWMSTHWQKRQYMTPWDENALGMHTLQNFILVVVDEFCL